MSEKPSAYEQLSVSKVDLKPWRVPLLRALLDMSEADASQLVHLHDFRVEDYVQVRFRELQEDATWHVDRIRKSEEEAAAKLQKEYEEAVHECLFNAFGGTPVHLVSLVREVEGKLMAENCGYCEGKTDFAESYPDTSLDVAYTVKFRVGGEDAPVAKLKFRLSIEYEVEFWSNKFYVNDLTHHHSHTAHCAETLSRDYPGLPGPAPDSTPSQTCEDRIKKLLEDIAIALDVQEWVIRELVSVQVSSPKKYVHVETEDPDPPVVPEIVELTEQDQ